MESSLGKRCSFGPWASVFQFSLALYSPPGNIIENPCINVWWWILQGCENGQSFPHLQQYLLVLANQHQQRGSMAVWCERFAAQDFSLHRLYHIFCIIFCRHVCTSTSHNPAPTTPPQKKRGLWHRRRNDFQSGGAKFWKSKMARKRRPSHLRDAGGVWGGMCPPQK